MTDDLIARVEQQLSAIITAGSGDVTERTIRDHGQRIVVVEDIDALIARVRELEAQAAADRAVRAAGVEYFEALDIMRTGLSHEGWRDRQDRVNMGREKFRAALAAREGERMAAERLAEIEARVLRLEEERETERRRKEQERERRRRQNEEDSASAWELEHEQS